MADRERSRSPERGDEGAAPAPAPADDYQAPAASADNDTGDAGASNGGATDDSVKLYVGNLHYGTNMSCFPLFFIPKHTHTRMTNTNIMFYSLFN